MVDSFDEIEAALKGKALPQAEAWLEGLEGEELLKFAKWHRENIVNSPGADMARSVTRVVPLAGLVKMKHFEVSSRRAFTQVLRQICPSRIHKTAWEGRPPTDSFYPMLRRLIQDGLVEKITVRHDGLDGEDEVFERGVKLTLKGLAYAAKHRTATMNDIWVWYDTDGVGPEKTTNRYALSRQRVLESRQKGRGERVIGKPLGEDGVKALVQTARALESERKKLEKVGKSIADQAQAAEDGVVRLTTDADQTLLDDYDKVMWRFAELGAYGPEGRDNSVDSTNVGLVTKWIIDGQATKCFAWLHPDQQEEVVHQVLDMGETSLPAPVKVMLTNTISEKRGVLYKNLVAYHKEIKGSGESAAQEVDELVLRVTWAVVRRVMDYRMGDPRYSPPRPPRDTSVMEKAEQKLQLTLEEFVQKEEHEKNRAKRPKGNL